MSRNSLTARTTPDFQLGPFFETDPTRIRNFYRIFSHKGDYFILRPSCQATPFDRIKCGFIRPVFVNANDKTNIKANLPLPTNSYFFHLMVSVFLLMRIFVKRRLERLNTKISFFDICSLFFSYFYRVRVLYKLWGQSTP